MHSGILLLRQLRACQRLVDAVAQQGEFRQPQIAIGLAQLVFDGARQLDGLCIGCRGVIKAQLIEVDAPQSDERIHHAEAIPAGAVDLQHALVFGDGFVEAFRESLHIGQAAARVGLVGAVMRAAVVGRRFLIVFCRRCHAPALHLDMPQRQRNIAQSQRVIERHIEMPGLLVGFLRAIQVRLLAFDMAKRQGGAGFIQGPVRLPVQLDSLLVAIGRLLKHGTLTLRIGHQCPAISGSFGFTG